MAEYNCGVMSTRKTERRVYRGILTGQMIRIGGKATKLAKLRFKIMRTSKLDALAENEILRAQLDMLSGFEKRTGSTLVSKRRLNRENLSLNIVAAGRSAAKMEEENRTLNSVLKEIDYELKKSNDAKERKDLVGRHNKVAARLSRNAIVLDEFYRIRNRNDKLLYRQ